MKIQIAYTLFRSTFYLWFVRFESLARQCDVTHEDDHLDSFGESLDNCNEEGVFAIYYFGCSTRGVQRLSRLANAL